MPKGYSEKLKKVFDKVYRTLKKAGYDDNSIAGILGNAYTESTFNPDSIGPSHYGLLLNDANIRNAIVSKYGDHSLDSQLKYLMDWNNAENWIRKGDYSTYTALNSGKYKKTGYKNAQEAADAFMRLYERPVIVKNGKVVGYLKHNERLMSAIDASNHMRQTYGGDDSSTVNFPVDWELVNQSQPKLLPPVNQKPVVPFEGNTYIYNQPIAQIDGGELPGPTIYPEDHDSPFKLKLKLPTLNELMAMDSPDQQLKKLIHDLMPLPNINPLVSFKNGKLPKYEDGEGILYADSTWHENWLAGRKSQMEDNLNTSARYKYLDNWTAENQIKRLKNTPEYNADLPDGVLGLTNGGNIYYDQNKINNNDRIDGSLESVKIHERTHAMLPLPQMDKIVKIGTADENSYLSDPSEIYSGLMELRYRLGLDPKHIVTQEEIQNWRQNGQLNDYLKNKSDDVLLEYFNHVASNKKPSSRRENFRRAFGTTPSYWSNLLYKNIKPVRLFYNV